MKAKCKTNDSVHFETPGFGRFFLYLKLKVRESAFMLRSLTMAIISVLAVYSAEGQSSRPSFSKFPAFVEKARVRSVNFKNDAAARSFHTRLSDALRGGVNFAGHYVVAGWGCGTGCISGAIIDARNRKVLWPLEFNALGVWYDGNNYVDKPVEYRKNSRLLIIRGSPGVKDNEPEFPNGEYFYEWTGRTLRFVKFIPYRSN